MNLVIRNGKEILEIPKKKDFINPFYLIEKIGITHFNASRSCLIIELKQG